MLRETVRTQVNLVNCAMNYWLVAMTNVAAAADPARQVPGFSCHRTHGGFWVQRAGLHENASSRDHGTQGYAARPQAKKAGVRVFTESSRQDHESEQHCHCSYADQPVARS